MFMRNQAVCAVASWAGCERQCEQAVRRTLESMARSWVIGLAAAVGFVVGVPGVALGCSCAGGGDIKDALKSSDAAFAGKLVRRDGSRYTFRVEEDFKRNLSRRVTVPTMRYSSCDLGIGVGDRIGLFLERTKRGGWFPVGTCNEFSPGELRARLHDLPAPNGRPPIRFVAGGFLGTRSRLLAFDERGRVVDYGYGRGAAEAVAACPGGARVVEVYSRRDEGRRIAIRRLDTMRVEDDRRLQLGGEFGYVTELDCRSADGADVVLFTTNYDQPPSHLYRVERGQMELVHSGRAQSIALAQATAFIDRRGKDLLAVDLSNGSTRTLARDLNGLIGLSASPDGTHLAGVTDGQSLPEREIDSSPDRTAVHSFDLRASPVTYSAAEIGTSGEHSATVWLDSERFVSYPLCCGRRGRLFAVDGSAIGTFSWAVGNAAVLGADLFGAEGDAFYRAQPDEGRSRRVRTLFANLTTALEPVRGAKANAARCSSG